MLAAGQLLGQVGSEAWIRQIMQQIIELVHHNVREGGKPATANWGAELETLTSKLILFLEAEITDISSEFEFTKPCCEAMMIAMERQFNPKAVIHMQYGPLLTTIAGVTRKLADRFWDDRLYPFGAEAMSDSVFETYNMMVLTSSRARRSRTFLIDCYRTLSACVYHPSTRPELLKELKSGKYESLAKASLDLIRRQHAADAEVTFRILEFLRLIANDAEGAQVLKSIVVRGTLLVKNQSLWPSCI